MSAQAVRHLAIACVVIAVGFGIGGLWWWALLGMTEAAGVATTFTAFSAGAAVPFLLMLAEDLDEGDDQ